MKLLNVNEKDLKSLISKKILFAVLVLILIAGCNSQAYQSTAPVNSVQQSSDVNYVNHRHQYFTMSYPDEWIEPKHYTRDYYYLQLTDFDPFIHVSVFDIEDFTNTTDYYETMSELFYLVFDFQEVDSYVEEDEMMMRGTMVDEEDDEVMVTFKVVVCKEVPLALDVTGLVEEWPETRVMIDKTVESFKCN